MKYALLFILSVVGSLHKTASGSHSYDACHQACHLEKGVSCPTGCSCAEYGTGAYRGRGVCQLNRGWTSEQVQALLDAQDVMETVTEVGGELVKKVYKKLRNLKITKKMSKAIKAGMKIIKKLVKALKGLVRFRG
uniref:Putative secreted protein n=1 Tax=Amblyomma parvum TaxID=251391 RepID=A0A023FZ94_AMBPA